MDGHPHEPVRLHCQGETRRVEVVVGVVVVGFLTLPAEANFGDLHTLGRQVAPQDAVDVGNGLVCDGLLVFDVPSRDLKIEGDIPTTPVFERCHRPCRLDYD